MEYARRYILTVLLVTGLLGLAGTAQAQRSGQEAPAKRVGAGLNEQLSAYIPKNVTFKNEQGKTVRLSDYLGRDKPVLLTLVYHSCPMLCPMMLGNLTSTLKEMDWTPGDQFEMVSLSFNHRETPELARKKKAQYIKQLGRPEAANGWHFLTGTKENIHQLTDAVGFNFTWLPEKEQYAHPATLIFLTEKGKIMRYLNGKALDVPPGDVRKALVETSNGKIGNVVDQVLLYCFQYDPNSNSYVKNAFNIMKAGGLLTMLVMGVGLFILWRREHQNLDEMTEDEAQTGWEQELNTREA